MYESFYGLNGLPFSLLPDADFLFLSKRHRRAINLLEYGMLSHAGFIVITGDVGAGKTTIIRRFIKDAGRDISIGIISNPSKTMDHLLHWIGMAFEIEGMGNAQAKDYDAFVKFLITQYSKGKRTVLIIDEAQNLTSNLLEELRMLSNVNNEKDQLLQIILVGQPELLEMLQRNEHRQFAQRISVHCHLDPLKPADTAAYILHRLNKVGASYTIFDSLSCAAIYYFTNGVPRLINLLCDQALVYGFSEDKRHVDIELISEVVWDRSRSGLSPYKAVPEGVSLEEFTLQLDPILSEIKISNN